MIWESRTSLEEQEEEERARVPIATQPSVELSVPSAPAPAAGVESRPSVESGSHPEVVEHVQLMRKVMEALHARTPAEALDQVERLVRRLERLDGVLPRYQETAARLFELLGVTDLEEVPTAVERLLPARPQRRQLVEHLRHRGDNERRSSPPEDNSDDASYE